MSEDLKIYMPSRPMDPSVDRWGMLSGFDPGTRVLPEGYRTMPPFRATTSEIVFEKDVAVTLRDGVTIHVDLFRPPGTEKVPVIVAWSPYGKGQGTSASVMGIFGMVGLDNGIMSGLAKFEAPDPAYWCARGYAICNPDVRGVMASEGDSVLWDRQEGRDCYDLIEWLGVQDWCTGKVGMSGTSYLAASQWFTAAEQPPHLAAINPWEGISDTYRDLVMRGGMPDTGFARTLRDFSFWGNGRKEDIIAEADAHPLMDDLWADKIPDYDRITVPAYVVASYSNTLHTAGTFRGWRRIASDRKWLRIHASQEWPDYYDQRNVEDLRRFFDHVLKSVDNGWEETPRVRYSLLDLEGGDVSDVPADQFPPAGTTATRLYLDGGSRTLTSAAPADATPVAYTVGSAIDEVSFTLRFDEETALVGYPKAHLFVEADGADDMDLFLLIQKLDVDGMPLSEFTVPNRTARIHDATDRGGSILRYRGSDGRLRVSLRSLDDQLSTDDVPVHRFDTPRKLSAGEIVEIEVDLLPLGLAFHPGESLRFVISSRSLLGGMMPNMPEYVPANSGRHVIHTGGETASYLQLPVRPASRSERSVRRDGDAGDAVIDAFELTSARRALALVKERLGRERLLEVLAPDIAAGDAFLRDHLARSSDAEVTGTTVLRASGISAREFGGWLGTAFAREDVMLAGHPEHYAIHAEPGRSVNIVETLGDKVCSFYMQEWDDSVVGAPQIAAPPDAAPTRRSRMALGDGTVFGSIATAFLDDGDGFTAHLSVTLPATCSPEVVDQHLEHFAVEFRTWILTAASELEDRTG